MAVLGEMDRIDAEVELRRLATNASAFAGGDTFSSRQSSLVEIIKS